jgi:type III secretion protein W
MSDRFDAGAAAFARTLPREAASTNTTQAAGSWRGEAVRLVPDALSLLADAKEELTFAHSERMESKAIAERNVEDAGLSQVERVQRIQELMEQLPDLDPRELDAFRAALGALRGDGQAMLRELRERFPDPSHAFAALSDAEGDARARGDTALADTLAGLRDGLEAAEGPAIRAGLNITRTAFETAEGDRAAAAKLRDAYRETVFARPGPAAVYKSILDRAGMEGFAEQLKFLTRALGDELLAAGPSVEKPQLRELLQDLSALRALDTVHERCKEMARRVGRIGGVAPQPTAIMQKLLPLTEEAISGGSRFKAIPEQVGVPRDRLDAQILFLREARDVMAMMPVSVYRDLDARLSALNGVQMAMDDLIEREETEA